ncbi:MAG: glycine cleavage system aminomethyltransferase GcvT [Rhodobacteraceae bacterium]|nr:glycine cleavage system aminomethyltransferase GcvT [Paracoccaceae bacterium]
MGDLRLTPLNEFHKRHGAKFAEFAEYDMPVQYPGGIIAEHLWTRSSASLFDVSHMGQVAIEPRMGNATSVARALETQIPSDLLGLPVHRQVYGLMIASDGGILDDLMISNWGSRYLFVVNAAQKEDDLQQLEMMLGGACMVRNVRRRAMIALQGPKSETALARLLPSVKDMRFLDVQPVNWNGKDIWVSRSGYTGEDGFEISLPTAAVEEFAESLAAMEEVRPAGLGARDSLRLEAGLCLYGNDIDESINPVEARLVWAIAKCRRAGGERHGGYPGSAKLDQELSQGPRRRRVGLRPEGRAPIRGGTKLFVSEESDEEIGFVSSGGFGPSVGSPVAMGYAHRRHTEIGSRLFAEVRGRRLPAEIVALPFVRSSYRK